MLLGWETSGPWSAGVEAFGTRTAADHAQAVGSLSVQYQASRRVQTYGEFFTLQPVNAGIGAHAEHYANSGVLLLLSNDMQVDARIGFGLNQQRRPVLRRLRVRGPALSDETPVASCSAVCVGICILSGSRGWVSSP